jgi:hypothetical protein
VHSNDDPFAKAVKQGVGHVIDGVRASFVQRRMCDLYVAEHGADADAGEEAWTACYKQAQKDWNEQHE